MTTNLKVEERKGSNAAIRAAGSIPAVVYGPKHDSQPITVSKIAFEKILKAAGESTIINLEGLKEEVEVLIHNVAFNAERGGVEHADFYAVERGKELTMNVTLEFIGESPAEKIGAMVVRVLEEVEVTCRPSVLPSHFDVDVTVLETVDGQITVGDLIVPEGVVINTPAEMVVATMAAAREEEPEATEAVEIDMDAVAVDGEKPEAAAEAGTEEKAG